MKPLPTEEQLHAAYLETRVDPDIVRGALARIKPSWNMVLDYQVEQGAAFVRGSLQVLFSVLRYGDGNIWLHVSACGRRGPTSYYLPSWEDMKRVKRDFIGEDRWAYQVFPPETEYVNQNAFVLHLYALLEDRPALPDFTLGLGWI